jgi:hypothetical protein
MASWWQQGYPGGPMVAVVGFPRPLYPPDAPGHPTSVDGSDVEAYKRTVSRAGRWQWQKFDQAFSNGFAYGRAGGNVGDSGIAGVQRQGGIEPDSGYVGRATFNLLRSIIVPAGLPHAGEYAMDATAVQLVNDAFSRFGGSEPAPDPSPTSARARLAKAQQQVGVAESPPQSNRTKYGSWYGMDGQPWCAMFATWCDQLGAAPSRSFVRGSRYAYVPYIVDDARRGLNGLSVESSPRPGSVVCYDWSRDGEFDHVGIIESGSASHWVAIEGNTSTTNQSNGGQVQRRDRSAADAAVMFVRVAE